MITASPHKVHGIAPDRAVARAAIPMQSGLESPITSRPRVAQVRGADKPAKRAVLFGDGRPTLSLPARSKSSERGREIEKAILVDRSHDLEPFIVHRLRAKRTCDSTTNGSYRI